ncbi:archaemetzincin-2-like [Ciona intestinalis]
MSWKKPSVTATKEALIGCNGSVKRNYKANFSPNERKFMERICNEDDKFFKPIKILGDADWLSNHEESGQTFESFWRSYANGELQATLQNDGGKPAATRPQTARASRPPRFAGSKRPTGKTKTICILQLGPFPGDEDKESKIDEPNDFMVWLKTYCSAFFYSAKVVVLPPVSVADVACQFRVNELTGRFQLKAADILKHLHKVKPKHADCLVAVTMTDLYPRPNWDFVFGLASTNASGEFGGVGVFSFARYDDIFYETWTQGKDEMRRLPCGGLDYSVFEKPPKRVDGSTIPVTDILLLRACRVMAHEVGHMFGLKHCIWSKCLMNGSNHIQESDMRPSFLCPVCLRKLQVVLGFDLLTRYKAMKEWSAHEFWKDYKYCPGENNIPTKSSKNTSLPMWERRTSLPDAVTRPKTAVLTRKGVYLKRPASSKQSILQSKAKPAPKVPTVPTLLHKKKYYDVTVPPLEEFEGFRDWLSDAVEALTLDH